MGCYESLWTGGGEGREESEERSIHTCIIMHNTLIQVILRWWERIIHTTVIYYTHNIRVIKSPDIQLVVLT